MFQPELISNVTCTRTDLSPELPPGARGLGIAVENVSVGRRGLRFWLLIAHSLPARLAASFDRVSDAIVVLVDDPASARAGALPLIDPGATLDLHAQPRFRRREGPEGRSALGGWASCDVRIAGVKPDHPTLYVRATLQRWVSNTVAISPSERTAQSYTNGAPDATDPDDREGD